MKYGTNGVATLMKHVQSFSHVQWEAEKFTSYNIVDRVCNMEAMACAFLAEYSLSFSLAQPMIGMCKELSKDSAALKTLHMFRTTARFVLLSFP